MTTHHRYPYSIPYGFDKPFEKHEWPLVIARLVALSDAARSHAIDDLVRGLRDNGVVRSLVRRLGWARGRMSEDDAQELEQLLWMSLVEMINAEVADPGCVLSEGPWEAAWWFRARHKADTFFEAEDAGGQKGASTAVRRRVAVRRADADFTREHGREATREELVEFANARMHARRKDPLRSGALLTYEDIAMHRDNAQSMRTSLQENAITQPGATQHVITAIADVADEVCETDERRERLARLLSACPARDLRLATAWLSTDPPQAVGNLMEELDMTVWAVREGQKRIVALAQEIFDASVER